MAPSTNLPPTVCPPHNYVPAGDVYNKQTGSPKLYRTFLCTACCDTKEVVVEDRTKGAA